MSIFETIVEKRNHTRKSGDNQACKLYQLILGEIETKAKRDNTVATDEVVLGVLKKMVKSNEESLKIRHDEQLVFENTVMNEYLPKMVNVPRDELAEIIGHEPKNIKNILNVLDTRYGSNYNKKQVVDDLKSL